MENEVKNNGVIDLSNTPIEHPEEGLFETYANVVNANWTLTDVRLRFGELIQQSQANTRGVWKDQEAVILERAAITLPWAQAKTLCLTLVNVLTKYEELNGEIKEVKLPVL